MNIRGCILVACFSLSLGAVLVACGDDDGGSGGDGGSSAGSATAGQAVAKSKNCAGCHGVGLSGVAMALNGAYPSNLTPDTETGIGSWTDAQIKDAIRSGTGDEGESLCSTMPKFAALSDAEVTDLVAFLRSLASVDKEVPASTCQ
jgi:mono/diheme cytochrome c family protein